MKKTVVLILAVILSICLAACGNEEEVTKKPKKDTAKNTPTSAIGDNDPTGKAGEPTKTPGDNGDKKMAKTCRRIYTNNQKSSNPYLYVDFDFSNCSVQFTFYESDVYLTSTFDPDTMNIANGEYYRTYAQSLQGNVEWLYMEYSKDVIKFWNMEEAEEDRVPETFTFISESWSEKEVKPTEPIIQEQAKIQNYRLVSQNGKSRDEITDTSDRRAAAFVSGNGLIVFEVYMYEVNLYWKTLGPNVMSYMSFPERVPKFGQDRTDTYYIDVFDYSGNETWSVILEFTGSELNVTYSDGWEEVYRLEE